MSRRKWVGGWWCPGYRTGVSIVTVGELLRRSQMYALILGNQYSPLVALIDQEDRNSGDAE